MKNGNLPPWEWLTIIGVICGAGVSVTVFAMTHFESSDNADKRESRLERRLARVETMQEMLLRNRGIEIPPQVSAE
jgi:hypothetical protein